MEKKLLKAIKISIITFIVISVIISLIVSQDEHHLETCNEDHCIYCEIIIFSRNIISLATAFVITIMISYLIYFFLSKMHKEQAFFVLISLISQKVQFNE